MLVYTRRHDVVECHELTGDETVDALKAYISDRVMFDGVELQGDTPLRDTPLDSGATVDLQPYTPPDHSSRSLWWQAPVPYTLVGATPSGSLVTVSPDSESLAVLHPDAPQTLLPFPAELRGEQQILALHVSQKGDTVHLLTPTLVAKLSLDSGELLPSGQGNLRAVSARVHPITLVSCAGVRSHGEGGAEHSVYFVSSSRLDLLCEDLAEGGGDTIVMNPTFSLTRATAFCGVAPSRIAVAYDEGVHVYCLLSHSKVFAVGLSHPPVGLAAPDAFHLLVCSRQGLAVVRLDSEAAKVISLPYPATLVTGTGAPAVPLGISVSGSILVLLSRYTAYVLR